MATAPTHRSEMVLAGAVVTAASLLALVASVSHSLWAGMSGGFLFVFGAVYAVNVVITRNSLPRAGALVVDWGPTQPIASPAAKTAPSTPSPSTPV